jgi:hypothetical protein
MISSSNITVDPDVHRSLPSHMTSPGPQSLNVPAGKSLMRTLSALSYVAIMSRESNHAPLSAPWPRRWLAGRQLCKPSWHAYVDRREV